MMRSALYVIDLVRFRQVRYLLLRTVFSLS